MSRVAFQKVGLLLVATLSQAQALNFTPRPEVQLIDGYPIPYYSFEDGDHRVTYAPPKGWKMVGSAARLNLEDPKVLQMVARFDVLPSDQTASLTPEITQKFKATALAMVPSDAQEVTVADGAGRSALCNREAYTVNVTYAFYGQKFAVRAVFANFESYFVQFVVTGPAQKFEEFVKTLDGSLSTWSRIPAK